MKFFFKVASILAISIILFKVLVIFSYSIQKSHVYYFLQFTSNKIFMVTIFNIIVYTIMYKNIKSSYTDDDFNELFPSFCYTCKQEEEEYHQPVAPCNSSCEDQNESLGNSNVDNECNLSNSSDDDDDDTGQYDSDGYFEDSDGSSGGGEIGWDDDDEDKAYDETLDSRIEDFIAKVTGLWREEKLAEYLYNPGQ
ncbi:hypothetical protein LIER_09882 [Lithospermum erythrorhizon]|uniref:Uncharacterized protein n=1 Tax=Lithospermum erythrorhizon TaxID=34254 RepID=A0AAV3PIM1_LITER